MGIGISGWRVAVLVTVAMVSGCGTQRAPSASEGSRLSQDAAALECQSISVSRVKSYLSIPELAADSQLVVIARVIPGTTQIPASKDSAAGTSNGPTADLVPLEVQTTLLGTAPKKLTLRVITSSCPGSDLPSPLEEGASYALFLKQFEYSPGQRTGEWVMTSDASVYRAATGDSGFTLLTKDSSDALPARLDSIAHLAQQLDTLANE